MLTLTWKGTAYEFKPSFELFLRVEEKVSFSRLADVYNRACRGDVADLPLSHVAWVLWCCAKHAGVPVRTPDDLLQALIHPKNEEIKYGDLIPGLLVAYYGAQPEKPPKKEPPAAPEESPQKSSPPSGKKSRRGTA